MSKIIYIWKYSYKNQNKLNEEFYSSIEECIFYRNKKIQRSEIIKEIDSISEIECVIVWNNVMHDEPEFTV